MITQSELKERLDYQDGELIWIKFKKNNQIKINSVAGWIDRLGYKRLEFNSHCYLVHKLVWLFFHGHLPDEIDHIDGNRKNNKIENLRTATHSQNMQNLNKPTARNKCGILGVYYDKWTRGLKKWRTCIRVNGKTLNLGRYLSIEEAEKVYIEARIKYYEFNTLRNS